MTPPFISSALSGLSGAGMPLSGIPLSGAPVPGITPYTLQEQLAAHMPVLHPRHNPLAACLPLLLAGLGWTGDARQLHDGLPYHPEQFGLADVLGTLAQLGYDNRRLVAALDSLPPQGFPCLFLLCTRSGETRHHVIHGATPDGWQAFCAEDGTETLLAEGSVSGVAYLFAPFPGPDSGEDEQIRARVGLTWFRDVYSRFTPLVWQVGLISVLVQFGTLTVPFFVMLTYDQIISAHSVSALPLLALGVGLALAAEWLLRALRVHALAWFGSRMNAIVCSTVFERLLFLPAVHTERAAVASQIARIKAFESVRDFLTGATFLTLIEMPFTVVLLVAIGFVGGGLVWILLTVMLAYAGLLLLMRGRIRAETQLAARAGADKQNMLMETFACLHELRAAGMVEAWSERFAAASAKSTLTGFRFGIHIATIEQLAYGLSMLAGVALLAVGVEKVWARELSPAAFVGTMILSWRVLNPLQMACSMLLRLEQLRGSIDQINRLMSIPPERRPTQHALVARAFRGEVAFAGVSLRYVRDIDPVFSGLSLAIKPGQLVAVTGGNGSGKTSLLKLVAGLYAPQLGTIRIDGIDIRQMDPVMLRRQLGYVPQAPFLFSGTLADTLRLTNPLLRDEVLWQALEQADAGADVRQLSNGLRTRIEDVTLPGALAWRLSLARLYADPHSIVLVDELPHEILNSRTGLLFRDFLTACRGVRTVFFVTQRRDYIDLADMLVALDPDQRPVVRKVRG
jgi:ATP-binding cassette, subfamily C, bacterial LapB